MINFNIVIMIPITKAHTSTFARIYSISSHDVLDLKLNSILLMCELFLTISLLEIRLIFDTDPHFYIYILLLVYQSIIYFLCPIRNETFFGLSLLFHFYYFTLSSLTHKTTLHEILCQKTNVSYLLGRREY